uniref:Uncharacterized protein n=1 Tax=Nothobranchius furzeri TaxID=105023 RepID=A0A1A8A026_NOTFU
MNSFLHVITNAARLYTGPTTGELNALTHRSEGRAERGGGEKRRGEVRERGERGGGERELTMVNKCTKTFFLLSEVKNTDKHPLSGNEMIEYRYCQTRPLKILTAAAESHLHR